MAHAPSSTHAANMRAAADHLDTVRNALVDDPNELNVNEQLLLGETADKMRRSAGVIDKHAGVEAPPTSEAKDLEAFLAQREHRDAGLGDPNDLNPEEVDEDDEEDTEG